MQAQSSDSLLALFDAAPLNRRYWVTFVLMSGVLVLDFFDFFLIAFVMSVIGREWQLTYGQGAIILYGAGVGAIIGSLVSGFSRRSLRAQDADRHRDAHLRDQCRVDRLCADRRLGVVGGLALLCRLWSRGRGHPRLDDHRRADADALAHRNNELFYRIRQRRHAACLLHRGCASPGVRLARRRDDRFCGGPCWPVGWIFVPESVRWLTAKGRFAEARAEVAKQLELPLDQRAIADDPAHCATPRQPDGALHGQPAALLANDRDLGRFCDGSLRLLSLGADHRCARSARRACPGRQIFRLCRCYRHHRQDHCLADRPAVGPACARRPLRLRCGYLPCPGWVLQWNTGRRVSVIRDPDRRFGILCGGRVLESCALYGRAIWSAALARAPRVWGKRQTGSARSSGPLALALLAGSGNVIAPKATEAAVLPAFIFLAGCMALVGLSFAHPRRRDAREGDGARREGDRGAPASSRARHRGALTGTRSRATAASVQTGRLQPATYSAANFVGRTSFSRIVTNSSAALGWMPTVSSNMRFETPHFTAIARPCMISGASGPSIWQPSTRSLRASTTSFIRVRSSRPDKVFFIGLKWAL